VGFDFIPLEPHPGDLKIDPSGKKALTVFGGTQVDRATRSQGIFERY